MSKPNIKHYYVLDVMRGLASISVVIWHYQHLFKAETGRWQAGYERSYQPLYEYLSIFYNHGGQGVQFFYLLSGAVFAYVYSNALATGLTGSKEFVMRRIARLYPLHFATLIIVLILQLLYVAKIGKSFIYPYNDFEHFYLQLAMVSHWGFQKGHSFNAPIWSVTMEIVSYGVFLGLMKLVKPRTDWSQLMASIFICATLMVFTTLGFGEKTDYQIAQAVFCFFLGHALFSLCRIIGRPRVLAVTSLIALVAVIATLSVHSGLFRNLIPYGLLFPAVLFAGICMEPYAGGVVKRARWVGDISYSTYLMHFPVQLFIAVMCAYFIDLNFYRVDVFMGINISILVIAYLVFHGFERPAQRALLGRWLKGGPGPSARPEVELTESCVRN